MKTVITEGVQTKDTITGETYCIVVANGQLNHILGECGNPAQEEIIVPASEPQPEQNPEEEVIEEEPVVDEEEVSVGPVVIEDLPAQAGEPVLEVVVEEGTE